MSNANGTSTGTHGKKVANVVKTLLPIFQLKTKFDNFQTNVNAHAPINSKIKS